MCQLINPILTLLYKHNINYRSTPHLKCHLQCWVNSANPLQRRCFQQNQIKGVIPTEMLQNIFFSCVYMNNQAFHGGWSTPPNKLHITILELEAVYLTVNVFLKELIGKFYWSDPYIKR